MAQGSLATLGSSLMYSIFNVSPGQARITGAAAFPLKEKASRPSALVAARSVSVTTWLLPRTSGGLGRGVRIVSPPRAKQTVAVARATIPKNLDLMSNGVNTCNIERSCFLFLHLHPRHR